MFSRSDSSSSMKDFEIPAKEPPLELLENWRKATLVLNATRRFRYTANVKRRRDAEAQKRRLRTTGQVFRAAFRFIDAAELAPPSAEEELKAKQCGFDICGQSLRSVSDSNGPKFLKVNGGVEGIADKLKVSLESGIKGDEPDIINRKTVFGSNTYTEKPAKGFFVFVWEAMQDLTLAILGVCALVSLVIGIATEGLKEGWFDGAGIIFSILLVVFVTAASDYQQSLQFRALDKEKKKLFVQVTRNGKRQKLSVFDLVVGDIVHLSIGDQVPADGLYINGYSLVIDESSMSGESEPKRVDEKYPFLLSGTKVQDGTAMMLVTGVGMNTEWGQLMAVLGEGGNDETPLQVKLNGVATLIGQIGVVFAVVTFIVLMIRFVLEKDDLKDFSGEDVKRIVDFFAIAVTIVVVAVPEGLPLAVTLTLAYAMNKMMDDKALVRHLAACETMGSATCICSDKTGTLTTNQMTVVKAWLGGSLQEDVGKKSSLPDCLLDLLLEGIFQNTSGDVAEGSDGKVDLLGTPTETAVLGYGLTLGGNFKNVRSKSKIIKCEPFNSSKKRMAVVVKHIDGTVRAHWKGASEIVLGMCSKYVDCNGQAVEIDYEKREELHEVITSFADEALRTLCLIIKDLENEPSKEGPIPQDGFTCLAVVGIKDPVRPGVKEAVKLCQSAGIKVRMVTGDNVNTAKAIARECGILTDGEVIEGPAFRQLNEEEMRELIPNLQVMARSHPTDKHILVKQLRTMQEVVAVTGDGTNDAPALHESDVGLAMGIAGTEVAKESADIIILDDKFQTIVTVAKWGRSVYTNIQKFVQFQLTVNLVALVLNFTSACLTGKAPLTAVQLLWVNLIMDTLGALALATEPPYDELMQKPPVGWKGNLISSVMWRNIIVQAVYQLIVLSILQYKGKDVFCGDDEDDDLVLNTLIFNSFVFCQIFNEINAREMEKLNVFRHTLNNWVFITVLVVTVTFQIFLVEFLGKLANTTPLNLQQWLISIIIGAFSLPIAVLAKLLPIPFSKSYRSNSSLSLESKKQI